VSASVVPQKLTHTEDDVTQAMFADLRKKSARVNEMMDSLALVAQQSVGKKDVEPSPAKPISELKS